MHHLDRHPRRLLRRALSATVLACAVLTGCQSQEKPKAPVMSYANLGAREEVPPYMKGTIWELANRTNDESYAVATYGLVGRLRGTGDSTASLQVRQWMVKQMARHGYGSARLPGFTDVGADQIMRDPNFAIVRVSGNLPPGSREGDFFDIDVTAMPGNKTTSVSGGVLFESELYRLRGNAPDLAGVQVLARAKGPIVVNPAYALTDADAFGAKPNGAQSKASLRKGTIMDGGVVMGDRPILLRLRQPSRPVARVIEHRINQRFQAMADKARKDVMPITNHVAAALDDGVVEVYVPKAMHGDWEHFMGVVDGLTLNDNPAVLVARAKQLTEEAVKPDAPLREISYALEAIGEPAMQFVAPLMVHPNADVSYAMARAALFIGDPSGAAQTTLLRIAHNDAHPFQLPAIQALGQLTPSPERNQKIRELLNSKNTLVRTEAYKVLARNKDASSMYSRVIKEKFALDVLPGDGEPIMYASRSGIPRIALIGAKPKLMLPVTFTTMNAKLMISSNPSDPRTVTIFFRDERHDEPIKMLSHPDIAEIIARLGGEGAPEEEKFDFTYGEIVAIVQELANQKKVQARKTDGRVTLAPFVFEPPRDTQDLIDTAPVIEDTRRNTDGAARADELEPNLPGTGAAVAQ